MAVVGLVLSLYNPQRHDEKASRLQEYGILLTRQCLTHQIVIVSSDELQIHFKPPDYHSDRLIQSFGDHLQQS